MKRLLFLIGIICSFHLQGQEIKEWLTLPPVQVGLPAFHSTKNVDNKTFNPGQLLTSSAFNIDNLVPEEGKAEDEFSNLIWHKTETTNNTVPIPSSTSPSLLLYATYFSNQDWMTGRLEFQFQTDAEVYIDGINVLTYDSHVKNTTVTKEITHEWIPGKHTIIVKVLYLPNDSISHFSATFKADKAFANAPVKFTTSPQRGKNIHDVLNGTRVGNIQLSPSGNYLLAEETTILDGKSNKVTYVYRITDKEIVYSFYGKEASDITWTPKEDKVSFLIQEGKGYSLFTYDPNSQKQECLIKADPLLTAYEWAPDRSYLLYYKREDFNDKNWELRAVEGMEDRQPYFRNRYFLYKYDLATGIHTRLTWGNLTTSLMSISHNGNKIIFSTTKPDYKEYPYSKQSVYIMDTRTYQVDTLWQDRLMSVQCKFSPDDTKLLISGGANAFGTLGINIGKGQIVNEYDTQLFIYDLASGSIDPITKHFNPSVSQYEWHADGSIYIIANDTDYVHLFRYKDHKIERVECPGDIIRQLSLSQLGNTAVYTASDESYPTRVYTLDLSDDKAQMWYNPAKEQYKNIVFGEVKDWDYSYKKGTVIDGRYYLPADFDPNKKYPLIVYYYGGTTPVERSFGGRWPFNLYAANGYIVYVMQPSGAIGFGQEFSARHQNNWGIITADEIIASTKAFIKAHPFIDAKRVGCMGASYGGFTTMYLQTKTDIFACAISHAGISSISSYWGEGYWGYSYSTNATAHSFPWNRKDIYVNQSPLFNADKVKKPILLLHGTADVNVPTGESIQFYTALKLLGKDVNLVLIKNADHAVVDYTQRIIWNNTILAYFAKYLKEEPAWWENMYKEKNL